MFDASASLDAQLLYEQGDVEIDARPLDLVIFQLAGDADEFAYILA